MSKYKPASLLSALFNTAIAPAYRLEYHLNLEASVDRFQLRRHVRTLREMDRGMYLLRDNATDVKATKARAGKNNDALHKAGKAQVAAATTILFSALESELTDEIVHGTPALALTRELDPLAPPHGPAKGFGPIAIDANGAVTVAPGGLLLAYLYYFVYFAEARAEILSNPNYIAAAVDMIQNGQSGFTAGDVNNALQDLNAQLLLPPASRDRAVVRTTVKVLSSVTHDEYEDRGKVCTW